MDNALTREVRVGGVVKVGQRARQQCNRIIVQFGSLVEVQVGQVCKRGYCSLLNTSRVRFWIWKQNLACCRHSAGHFARCAAYVPSSNVQVIEQRKKTKG